MKYERILGPHHFAVAACMVTHSSGLCFSSRLQLGHPEKVTHFLCFSYCSLSHPNPPEGGGERRAVQLLENEKVGQGDGVTVRVSEKHGVC